MPNRGADRSGVGRAVTRTVAVAGVVLLLAGCSGSASPPARSREVPLGAPRPRAPAPTTTTTQAPLPVPPVDWTPCGALQCGAVTVPLDYARPGGSTLQIAVARHPAEMPGQRIGSLVINPGGPGASGIDDLPNELSVLTPELLDRFDIVSFDPRGVGRSSPVNCPVPSDPGSNTPVDPVPTTPTAQRALFQADRSFAERCEQGSGSLLPFVGTVDTARDLDRIRAGLGDTGLTFVGNSYGTLLGASYAELFPTHVRAMVLDGAIDPALSTADYAGDQADSLESELTAFLAWCAADTACPWRPAGDPTAAVLDLIARSRTRPLPVAGGGTAGPVELYDALLAGLESQPTWPTLAGALAAAASGNGSAVASLTDHYATGGSSNGAEAEQAINCEDHPVDPHPGSYPALAATLARSAPVFGPLLAWDLLACAPWPARPSRTPARATDPGAPPILVIGTTGDPVTPYRWSVALAAELDRGSLLTWRGQSHVAYFYSPCVRAATQAYLVDGIVPPPGTTCAD